MPRLLSLKIKTLSRQCTSSPAHDKAGDGEAAI